MRLAVTLDLGHFVQRFPPGTQCDVVLVDTAAEIGRLGGEHPAVGHVAVVRQRQCLATGLGFVRLQPGVEIEGIVRAERRLGRQRGDLAGTVSAVAQDYVAVQVVAFRDRRPFEADEGGEPARLVELVSSLGYVVPDPGVDLRAGAVVLEKLLGKGFVDEVEDHVDRRFSSRRASYLERLVPFLALGFRHDVRSPVLNVRRKAHHVGMVRDHEPVERPAQFGSQAG